VEALIVVSRAIHFASVALLFGMPLFRLVVARGPFDVPGGRRVEVWAAILALLSGLGWFAGVAAAMAGGWSDAFAPDMLATVVLDTRFGRLWLARLACLVAIFAVHALGQRSRRSDIALAIPAAAFAASLVGVGHGLAGGRGGDAMAPIHAVADMVHLLCAAIWIGGLFCLGRLLGAGEPDAVRHALPRFSRIGYWAVALLVISGCVNALVLVATPDRLVTTDYGRMLLIKIGLAVAMVAVALVNRLVFTPKIAATAQPADIRGLWRSVLVEQGVGLLVLAVVARLGTIHPVP
jgi:putative copper resistance protein D